MMSTSQTKGSICCAKKVVGKELRFLQLFIVFSEDVQDHFAVSSRRKSFNLMML